MIMKMPKPENMDWVDLKVKFFASNFIKVSEFLRHQYKLAKTTKIPPFWYQKVVGWYNEKQAKDEARLEQGMAKVEEAEKKKLDNIKTALSNLHQSLAMKFGNKESVDKLSYKEASAYWRILRTVIGEPVVVTKNTNINIETNIKKAKANHEEALKKLEEEGLL